MSLIHEIQKILDELLDNASELQEATESTVSLPHLLFGAKEWEKL